MVQLSTLLIFPTTFLLFQLSSATVYCPGDTKRSGCWMCQESELGQCWQEAVKEIDEVHITRDLEQSANTFCRGFAKLAKCWTTGTCCSEYAPLLAAATNLCNLKTRPEITRDQLEKFVGIANYVRETIWHNDSGLNVPKLAVTVKAYNSDSSESTHSDSYTPTASRHTAKSNENSNGYYKKSTQKANQVDENEEDNTSNVPVPHDHDYSNKKSLHSNHIHSFHPKLSHRESGNKKVSIQKVQATGQKVHHQAKCAVRATKCQSDTAKKYHQARSNKPKKSPSERTEHHFDKRSSYYHHDIYHYKRTKVTPDGCGLDFQGVPYPQKVPETVAKVYSEL